ncbi:Calcipressin-1 Down syndrome critical region protein 1-like protein [Larimichthys crocea]|uniref:Calcipressin-1 Down syndrome critical region protein 1-like protein n=1 Tax=Larimichthys crocea TaxID=215358 RepID=A0A6G0HHS5_LARCR|nr:Calcipressin-1 Down syndrome critical region protein 1-like protein [Larimichthys crocea]
MQHAENGSEEEATVDVQFTDLPNALIACKVPEDLFNEGSLKASFEALFRSFDPEVQFQYFKSFRRVRISFSDALAAAEARLRLHKTDFNGKEMRLYFAQVTSPSSLCLHTHHSSVHIGSPRLEPPKPDKQFLISPPASPPVGWEQSQDATPVINYDLLCAISKLGPGEKYELHTATPTTPSVVVHVCEDERGNSSAPDDSDQDDKPRPARPKIIQTRRPDYTPGVEQ